MHTIHLLKTYTVAIYTCFDVRGIDVCKLEFRVRPYVLPVLNSDDVYICNLRNKY